MLEHDLMINPKKARVRARLVGSEGLKSLLIPLIAESRQARFARRMLPVVLGESSLPLRPESHEFEPDVQQAIDSYRNSLRKFYGTVFNLVPGVSEFTEMIDPPGVVRIRLGVHVTDDERRELFSGPIFPRGDVRPNDFVSATIRLSSKDLIPRSNRDNISSQVMNQFDGWHSGIRRRQTGPDGVYVHSPSVVPVPSLVYSRHTR